MPQLSPCQACGKFGGKVVDFSYDGISMSMWICPHCGPGSRATLQEWAEKRLDSDAAALSLLGSAFRRIEQICLVTSEANRKRLEMTK